MIEIKKLPQTRWKEYRDLRLEALKKDPLAFGSVPSEEKKFAQSEWKKRTKNVLFALKENKPVGMIVYIFQKSKKIKHIANIYSVYVKEKYRKLGIGKQLFATALNKIKENKDIIKINLNVNSKQKAARALYKKYGFKEIGILKKDLYVKGNTMMK